MVLSRWKIVSSFLFLFVIHSHSQRFACPLFEKPAECPSDDDWGGLCQPEGKIGIDGGCPPGFMCCNIGCHFLDCVVPEVAPFQPQKVRTTKVTGQKKISVPEVAPTQPQKVTTTEDPGNKIFQVPVCEKLQNAFQNLKRQLDEIQKELKNLPKEDVDRRKDSSLPKNCAELYKSGETISGVYTIDPDGSGTFDVYCDQKTADGGWTVFQKRLDGSVDFYRGWKEYKNGFGNQNGEFWLGLDKIHRLTISDRYKLRVDLEDTEGNVRYAEYDLFAVASESTGYQLILGSYSGTAGNSLTRHRGKAFSTPDRDNDRYWPHNCASMYKGAWWFDDCLDSNLNGPYHRGKPQSHSEGIYWYHRKEKNFSVKRTEMKIKPVNA